MRKGTRMLALEHARRAGDVENRFRDRTGREHLVMLKEQEELR